ncbi:hypothetical protein [Streptomyces sp. LN549]|uniref:hypothetical protein n=1 Tax=Streptomyces sp. LN549 TaxID=3112979 RepID=UPI0037195EEC
MPAIIRSISVVLTPDWNEVVHEDDDHTITRRSDEEIDRFAEEIQEHTQSTVTVAEYSNDWEPFQKSILIGDEGLLSLITQEPGPAARALLSRTVLIDAWNSTVPNIAEVYQLAAVIDSRRYFKWRTESEREYGGGLYGRKLVVAKFGGSWKPGPVFETPNYCYFQHDAFPTLPSVLAEYIRQYTSWISHLDGTPLT